MHIDTFNHYNSSNKWFKVFLKPGVWLMHAKHLEILLLFMICTGVSVCVCVCIHFKAGNNYSHEQQLKLSGLFIWYLPSILWMGVALVAKYIVSTH